MNPGGIRDSLPQGEVLARHVWNVLPFDNALVEAMVDRDEFPKELRGRRRFDPKRTYRLVTNDYVADQRSEYGLDFKPLNLTLRGSFLDWVKARKVLP